MFSLRATQALIIALGLSTLLHSNANAQTIKEKDWQLVESTSNADPAGICQLYTTGTLKKSTIYFQLMRRKNSGMPTEIIVQQVGTDPAIRAINGYMENAEKNLYAVPMVVDASGNKTFWMLPRSTATIIDAINKGDAPRISVATDSKQKVNFSSKGFAKLYLEFQKRCAVAGQSSNNADFEAGFLANVQKPIDPLGIQLENAQKLRLLYSQSYGLFYQLKDNQKQIDQLNAQFAVQLNESASLTSQISSLKTKIIPGLKADLATSQANQKTAEANLVTTTQAIPGLQAQLEAAQKRLDKAEAVIAPFVPEFNRLDGILDDALNDLQTSQSRLAEINAAIVSNDALIRNLNNELINIDNRIFNLRSQLNVAISQFEIADRRAREFNPQLETARRIANDFEIRNLRTESQSLARQAEMMEPELQKFEIKVREMETALAICQADAAQDCSTMAVEVAAARNRLQTARAEQGRLIVRAQDLLERARFREVSIAREVEREYDMLLQEVRRTQDNVEMIRSDLQNNQRRRDQIVSFDLPDAQRRGSILRDQRAVVEGNVAEAQVAVKKASSALEAYKAKVDWNPKKAELDAATDLRDERDIALSAAIDRKAELERRIVRLKQEQIDLAAAIVARTSELEKAEARLVVVKKSLEPYVAAKAKLDATRATLSSTLAANQRQFEGILP